MIRKIAISVMLFLILGSCAAPEAETSPHVTILVSPQPTAIQRADIGDGGLLSGVPCAVPCVYGIRIGETSLDQVIPLLEQSGLSECQREESASWIGITCGNSVVVQVDRATSIVNGIGFYPSVPISLREIIAIYGQPDFVLLQTEGSAEAPSSRISLAWDMLKMTIGMPQIDSHIYDLEGTTLAGQVAFFDEAQYISSSELPFGQDYMRWNGYGAYQP